MAQAPRTIDVTVRVNLLWPWETVHRCPPLGSGLTPCCGKTPFELPRTDRLTVRDELVTCGVQV